MAIRKQVSATGKVQQKNPTPIINEQTPIVLKGINSNFADGTEKAEIISFNGISPVETKLGLTQRVKVEFGVFMEDESVKRLPQNFLLINHPNQNIHKLLMSAIGRVENVTPKDIIGKKVGIEIKNVKTETGVFPNVVDIFNVDELEDDCNVTIQLEDVDNNIEEYEY